MAITRFSQPVGEVSPLNFDFTDLLGDEEIPNDASLSITAETVSGAGTLAVTNVFVNDDGNKASCMASSSTPGTYLVTATATATGGRTLIIQAIVEVTAIAAPAVAGRAGLTVVSPPSALVSLADAKQHLRVTSSYEDALISGQILSAVKWAETYLRRTLVTAQFDWTFDCFPGGVIEVPRPPLQSVESITYLPDGGGAAVSMDSADYTVDAAAEPGRIAPAISTSWPETAHQIAAVTIRFTAGYGGPGTVPDDIRQAILTKLGALYQNRDDMGRQGNSRLAETLLAGYRVPLA